MMGYHKPVDPRDIWEYATRKLTDVSNIWEYATRKLTDVSNIWEYATRRLTNVIIASDDVKLEDTNEYQTTTTAYVTIKKYCINCVGSLRLKYKYRSSGGGKTIYVKILKNSDQIRSKSTTSTTYQSDAFDVDVMFGDTIELQAYITSGGTGYIKDVQICYQNTEGEVVELE